MIKPWSIGTTARNPERLRGFLDVLKTMEGTTWNREAQIEYQKMLIQRRLYGYGEHQFYGGLSPEQVNLIDDRERLITDEDAARIFKAKRYKDPPMRGRQSANPLKKFGFAETETNRPVRITELGNLFLDEAYDLQDVFLRVLLKWQFPNPYNQGIFRAEAVYNIKPFVGVLHLIRRVNALEEIQGRTPKGLSKQEFCLFAPTLVHCRDIEQRARIIVETRSKSAGLSQAEQKEYLKSEERKFAAEFLASDGDEAAVTDWNLIQLLQNLRDYGDNAIRYFRLTAYIRIRGNGFYIDLEPRRFEEINALLVKDDGSARSFQNPQEFLAYIADIEQPVLPWDETAAQLGIIRQRQKEIHDYERKYHKPHTEVVDPGNLKATERKELIRSLEAKVRELRDDDRYRTAQLPDSIRKCQDTLDDIRVYEDSALVLEKCVCIGLSALNDALSVHPNYPVGDDNEPTFTAPANVPDIECFYETFNAICEVTMLTNLTQWYHEGQPVSRHLRDFEDKYSDKMAYCLFIAPRIHRDTINTFWLHNKYEYEGESTRIVPLTVAQFSGILSTVRQLRVAGVLFRHESLQQLFDSVLMLLDVAADSKEWMSAIPTAIKSWQEELIQ